LTVSVMAYALRVLPTIESHFDKPHFCCFYFLVIYFSQLQNI